MESTGFQEAMQEISKPSIVQIPAFQDLPLVLFSYICWYGGILNPLEHILIAAT